MRVIPLTRGQVTKVDDEVFVQLGHLLWYAKYDPDMRTYYAVRHCKSYDGKRGLEYLHRRIVPVGQGRMVDHINGDTLDNQQDNLRIVTNRVNQQNRLSHRNGRLPGTTYHKQGKKWQARITVDGRIKHLGLFATEQEAHARYMAAIKTVAA